MSNRGTACDVAYSSGEAEQPSTPDPTYKATASDRTRLEIQTPYATPQDAVWTKSAQKVKTGSKASMQSERLLTRKQMPLVHVHQEYKHVAPLTASKHTLFTGFERAFESSRLTHEIVSKSAAGGEAVVGGEDMRGSPEYDPPPKRRKMGGTLAAHPLGLDDSSHIPSSSLQQQTQIDRSQLDEDEMTNSERVFSAARPTSHTDADSESLLSARNSGTDWNEEEYAAWLVRNDIQRCEAFIFTLQAVVEGCKRRGRADTLELLATELEKVIDRLNRPN